MSTTRERLIREINDLGPIATPLFAPAAPGTKGAIEKLGEIGVALVSGGVVKSLASVLVEFIKRNPRYVLKVGDITISKDHATRRDIEVIHAEFNKIYEMKLKAARAKK